MSEAPAPDVSAAPSAEALPQAAPARRRPHQQAHAIEDLTPAERHELADLIEAELARL